MSFAYNRAEILKAAHFMTRWRLASAKGSYRETFARELAAQWKKAKAARARFEQNTGLPIRSCLAEAPAYLRPARLFAGPAAFEAAVSDTTCRAVASSFTPARLRGRTAAWAV